MEIWVHQGLDDDKIGVISTKAFFVDMVDALLVMTYKIA